MIFWFAHGFNWVDVLVRSWGFSEIVNGLLYTGILMFVYSLVMLPFSIYGTFVIEQHYGFNKTTPGTFIADRLKGLFLAVLLGRLCWPLYSHFLKLRARWRGCTAGQR